MFESFTPFAISVEPNITIAGIRSPSHGPPLLLLHGFPQSHHIWHRVAALLDSYTLVLPDLRGYGASSKPVGTNGHHEYAKSRMALDMVDVMSALGFQRFAICAHDRGARVAHKLCVDHPDRVSRALFLDICPTLAMYEKTNLEFATAYFHWFFLIQPVPFPETMINAAPEKFGRQFLAGRYGGIKVFDEDNLKYYLEVLSHGDAVHGMCEDYRAGATVDMEEAREDIKMRRKVQCPLRVLWGEHGIVGKCFDAVVEWKEVHATGEVDGESVDCGHYIPEEVPDVLTKHIKEFLI